MAIVAFASIIHMVVNTRYVCSDRIVEDCHLVQILRRKAKFRMSPAKAAVRVEILEVICKCAPKATMFLSIVQSYISEKRQLG